ncbi:MAG: DUF1294 domain-containing protein [Oscillospiraceae bacterium]|nr:DUF1294 domain-containing protein [Oscillospiraceae bacterium]
MLKTIVIPVIAGIYLVMSIIAFIFYGRDKRLAREKKWRIPEKVLLLLGFLGGGFGAVAGMEVFRHKTKHWYFWAVNIAGIVWQTALLIVLVLIDQGILKF